MMPYTTFFVFVLIKLAYFVRSHTEEDVSLEYPNVFTNADHDVSSAKQCNSNSVVAAWCDSYIFPELQCAILPQFNEYGCSCVGHASLCPTECIGDSQTIDPSEHEPIARTHETIRCLGIPRDEPNYVLGSSAKSSRRSGHRHNPAQHAAGCQDNAIVASWCDESINPHLQCFLHPELDQYKCHCSGKHAYCPDECIGGSPPVFPKTTSDVIVCTGIPEDSPNYILKEE
jgi:hypothetical protein